MQLPDNLSGSNVIDLTSGVKKWAKVAAPCASIAGFVTDVLTPLGNIVTIFLVISIVTALVSGIVWFWKKKKELVSALHDGVIDANEIKQMSENNIWSITFAFSIFNIIILSLFLGVQTAMGATKKGLVAENVPAVASLQASLFKLEKNLNEVNERTKNIQSTITQIDKKIDNLGQNGGVIENPRSAEDFLHNAGLYQAKSDFANSRVSYTKYFQLAEKEFVDVHRSFLDLLKFQEGLEGAKTFYRQFSTEKNNPVRALTKAILEEREKRLVDLETLVKAAPDFAPAWLELAHNYSSEILGHQSISDKMKEKEYLQQFQKLHQSGKFVSWFLDKSKAETQMNAAQLLLSKLEHENFGLQNPVTFTSMNSNQGWSLILTLHESADEIYVKLDQEKDFKSTGLSSRKDSATGKFIPETVVYLGTVAHKMKFQVKYKNSNGETVGPYDLEFDPQSAIVSQVKTNLKLTKEWYQLNKLPNGKTMVYFTLLKVYSSAIQNIHYQVNEDEKPVIIKLNGKESEDISTYAFFLPDNTQKVKAQIYYMDGTKSEILEKTNR